RPSGTSSAKRTRSPSRNDQTSQRSARPVKARGGVCPNSGRVLRNAATSVGSMPHFSKSLDERVGLLVVLADVEADGLVLLAHPKSHPRLHHREDGQGAQKRHGHGGQRGFDLNPERLGVAREQTRKTRSPVHVEGSRDRGNGEQADAHGADDAG